ncbi:hypothetical protein FRC06_008626, partial [Ceratobasidium sp. 370]
MAEALVSGAACTIWFDSDYTPAHIQVYRPVNKEFAISENKVTSKDATFLYNEKNVIKGKQQYFVRSAAGKTVINIGPADQDFSAV